MSIGVWSSAHSNRTGWAGRFVFGQSLVLVFVAVWSLGGRADGAIPLIATIAWSSLVGLLLGTRAWHRLREYLRDPLNLVLVFGWVYLVAILLIAPMNAEGKVVETADGIVYEPRAFISWLPSAFVQERCREYGFLLSGLLVQAAMLWLFTERLTRIRQWVTLVAFNALLAALLGAAFRLLGNEQILGIAHPVHPGYFGPFRYHNHWTAYALLSMGQCLALSIYWFQAGLRDRELSRKRPEVFWFCGLCLFSMTLPMTEARAGVLFLALFWGFLAAAILVQLINPVGQRKRLYRWLMPLAGAFVAMLVVAGSVWLSSPKLQAGLKETLTQFDQLEAGAYGELDWVRTDSWGDGWRMFQDRPVLGAGFGSHRYLYQVYARDQYRYENGIVKHIKEFAHNDWMQYLAELGIVGCLLLLAPPLCLIHRYWSEMTGNHMIQALLLSCGLIMLLATFEFPLSNPAVMVVFALQFALALKMASLLGRERLIAKERAQHGG